jgi:hypothetical protein
MAHMQYNAVSFNFQTGPGEGWGESDSDTVITGVKDILSMNCHIPYSQRVTLNFRISRDNRASRCSSRRTRDHKLSYRLREAGFRVLVEHPKLVSLVNQLTLPTVRNFKTCN